MANYFWVGGTGTWSATGNTQFAITSGGVPTLLNPTTADTVTFDSLSGTGTCTTSGLATASTVTLNTSTLGLTLGANLSIVSTFTLTLGALDLGNNVLTSTAFSSSNSNTRSIAFGTGKISITGNAATVFNLTTSTNFTYTGNSNIEGTYNGSTGTRTFLTGSGTPEALALNYNIIAGSDTVAIYYAPKSIDFTGFTGAWSLFSQSIYGSLTISAGMSLYSGTNTLTFKATSGTQQATTNGKTLNFPITFNGIGGTFAFQDVLTQGSTRTFTVTNGTVQLKNGVTSTVGAFATSGTNQKFLESTLAGSQATLSKASGTVNTSYLTIKDINAVGGATWNAFTNQLNIDAGNNDGWDFGISPVVGGAEYTYALRSFTQPRRF